MESGHLSVEQRLQSHAANTIQKNGQILRSIIKCIIFCGRQNIPLRGHRSESSPYSGENNFATSGNPGNFQCLLQFRMDVGDVLLQDHFSNADKNAHRSPTIQNDLIAACKQWIQERIINEVKSSKYFAVCADEAADISNKEQLPLVLRFVDSSGSNREEFIEFIHCDSGTSGAAISEKILSGLEQLGLDPKDLVTAVVDSLQDIATEYGWNSESSHKASSLLSAVRQFCFIHTFTVVRHGLGFIKGITPSLQSRAHDIVCAYNEILHVVQRIEEVRQCIDDEHAVWFAKVETLSNTFGCDAPAMPRICGRQQNRSNTPATTASSRESQQFRSLASYLVKCNAAFRICKRRLLLQWQSCLRAYPFSKLKRKWSLYMVQIFLLQLPSQRNSPFGNTSGRTSPLLKHLPP